MPLKVTQNKLDSGVEVLTLAGSLTLGRDAQNFEWTVEELIKKNYDLSATNPKRKNGFSHRPPEELIADIADKQARISELIGEIQELLAGEDNHA